jgi:hypothetical protein
MAEPAELPSEFPDAPFPLESFELVLFSRSEGPPVHDETEPTREILQNDPVIAAGVDRYELMRIVTRRGAVPRPG